MTIKDNFLPIDYYEISSNIENSIKSKTDIKITKTAPWLRASISRAYYAAFLSLRKEFESNSKF